MANGNIHLLGHERCQLPELVSIWIALETYTPRSGHLTSLKSMFTYGPQSPTAYANGPSIVEKQDEWIVAVLNKMRAEGKTRLNANEDAEQEWKKTINTLHGMSLRDKVDGWYMGTNIPGPSYYGAVLGDVC